MDFRETEANRQAQAGLYFWFESIYMWYFNAKV
jgi:hypothetical protein